MLTSVMLDSQYYDGMANLNTLTHSGKNRTNNFLYPARQHLRLSGHICIRLLNRRNTKSGVHYCPEL